MIKATVKVEGLRALDRALGELPKRTAKATLRRVLKKAAEPMVDAAKARAPVLTGGLRLGIHAGTKLSRSQRKATRRARKSFAEIYVGPPPHSKAITQEFGAEHHPAQPYMRPAWDAVRFKVLEIIKSELWGEIRKSADRIAQRSARLAKRTG